MTDASDPLPPEETPPPHAPPDEPSAPKSAGAEAAGAEAPKPESPGASALAPQDSHALLILLAAFLLLYYPVGALMISRVDDDPNFGPGTVENGASHAVATAAALIDREVDQHAWPANDPFFYPGWILDNMPNYQTGIVYALSRFAVDMTDQIGRTRGSSQADPDLDKAAGLLKYPPNVWIYDPTTSWAPTASSESQYRAARSALLRYNDKLASQQAVFERRADNLLSTLDRFAADIGSTSAILDQRIRGHASDFVDFHADDVFYNAKGKLYAYALLFRALGIDFAKVLGERDLKGVWDQTEQSLMEAATLRPLIVINGRPDGLLLPNHLAVEGFYLLRARTQLREITSILAK